MKKSLVYFLILLLLVGGLVTYIVLRNKNKDGGDTEKTDSKKESVVETVGKDDEKDKEGEKDDKEIIKKTTSKKESDTDFSTYSSKKQEVGEVVEDDMFTLEKIVDTERDGYHEFVFSLKGPSKPHAVAYYSASSGVIKIELSNVEKDNSGIKYQGERAINKEGVIRLYHNVSGSQDKSFYDVGLSQSTVFKLDVEESSDEKWDITLNVKYPGEKESLGNLGSTEFSSKEQTITGVGAEKKASINSFEYGASGGVLKFVLGVSAEGDNPIPSATAKYNDDGDLVVTFDSLSLDRVGGSSKTYELPLGITLNTSRSGSTSVFTFVDAGSEYRLSANLSPNQVIIEIK